MRAWGPPLPHFLVPGQTAIERANRAEVLALVEQRRVDLGGRLVDKARAVQPVQDRVFFRIG